MNRSVMSEQRLVLKNLGRRCVREQCLAHVGACLLSALFVTACSGGGTSQPASAPPPSAPSNPSPMAASHGSAGGGEKALGPLKVTVPAGWTEQAPTSSM